MLFNFISVFLIGFAVTIIISPLIIKLAKKIKAEQTILHYVKEHSSKQGTPTMGGLMFILPAIIIPLIFFTSDYMYGIISLAVFLAYAVLGFLDDFIKVHYKQNLGLRAYQKILGQLGISIIVAIFVYKTIGSTIFIPFTSLQIDLGWFIIPFIVLIYLSTVNSVNLIDGLDGLSTSSSINYLFFFAIILILSLNLYSGFEVTEIQNLTICIFALLGCLFAFLFFNCYPAKIFMGDTGSLAVGALMITVASITGTTLHLLLFGLPFVVTGISVLLQVAYYKLTKKRIFLMAPLHHHFEKLGWSEVEIVRLFWVFGFILAMAGIIFGVWI